jgi:tellurite resistance protein TerC
LIDSVWAWLVVTGLVLGLLGLDFLITARHPHEVGLKEATLWSIFYIAVAVAFGVALWPLSGADVATEYLTGWLVEKSLSIDNLFVFVIILAQFGVPGEHQQKVLLFGIAAALAMRAVFIMLGATALAIFSPTFLLFGLLLIWTAVQLIRHRYDDPDIEGNLLLRGTRRLIPVTNDFRNGRLMVREGGKRVVTPLFLVFVAIGSTDLLFALDSIPAIFGITQHPLIVFAANAFALLGLRALYFLIEGLLQRLVYLSVGLAIILAFIGIKLILTSLHQDASEAIPEIPTLLSLLVIALVLTMTVVASLMRVRRHPEERAHAGALRLVQQRQAEARSKRH